MNEEIAIEDKLAVVQSNMQVVLGKLSPFVLSSFILGMALYAKGEAANLILLKLLAVPLIIEATRNLSSYRMFPVLMKADFRVILHTILRLAMFSFFLTILLWSPLMTINEILKTCTVSFLCMAALKLVFLAAEYKLARARYETEQQL